MMAGAAPTPGSQEVALSGLSIPAVLAALAEQRPVFHSEADFQHTLAWEIHRRLPDASVRLERPVKPLTGGKPLHVDIWVERDGEILAIELKYKTRALQTSERGEEFVLQNHSAQDIARYDFIKDVWRVETIVANYANATGYAILLTNDPSYWTRSHNNRTVDAEFRLHQGRELHGTLDWGSHASEGTKRGREKLLRLAGSYPLQWEDYSRATAEAKWAKFRYLVVETRTP